jgi:hypothetical protein
MRKWFYRLTAAHFIVSALTGLALYFRPQAPRPGLYSVQMKEWLVMIHNGEWLSYVLFGQPFWSGLIVGLLLAFVLIKFSVSSFFKK